jgi:hypothetical protein
MYDASIVYNELQRIEYSLQHIIERTERIQTVNDFLTSPEGVDILDMVCMRLLAIGETRKTTEDMKLVYWIIDF